MDGADPKLSMQVISTIRCKGDTVYMSSSSLEEIKEGGMLNFQGFSRSVKL